MKLSLYGISERGLSEAFKDSLVYGDHKLELVFRDGLGNIDIFVWCSDCKEFRKISISDKTENTDKRDYLFLLSRQIRGLITFFKNHNPDSCELVKIGKIMGS